MGTHLAIEDCAAQLTAQQNKAYIARNDTLIPCLK